MPQDRCKPCPKRPRQPCPKTYVKYAPRQYSSTGSIRRRFTRFGVWLCGFSYSVATVRAYDAPHAASRVRSGASIAPNSPNDSANTPQSPSSARRRTARSPASPRGLTPSHCTASPHHAAQHYPIAFHVKHLCPSPIRRASRATDAGGGRSRERDEGPGTKTCKEGMRESRMHAPRTRDPRKGRTNPRQRHGQSHGKTRPQPTEQRRQATRNHGDLRRPPRPAPRHGRTPRMVAGIPGTSRDAQPRRTRTRRIRKPRAHRRHHGGNRQVPRPPRITNHRHRCGCPPQPHRPDRRPRRIERFADTPPSRSSKRNGHGRQTC